MSSTVRDTFRITALLVLIVFTASWFIGLCESHCDACHCDGVCAGPCVCVADLNEGGLDITGSQPVAEARQENFLTESIHCKVFFHPPQTS